MFEHAKRASGLAQAQRCRQPCRAGADDHHVGRGATASRHRLGQALRHLQSLRHGVLDQTHAAQLADDVDARPARLEVLVHHREIDAALGGAEDELDGVDRALGRALPVADALIGVNETGRPVYDAEDVALGAGLEAGQAADADVRVDHRMQGHRDLDASPARLLQRGGAFAAPAPAAREVNDGDRQAPEHRRQQDRSSQVHAREQLPGVRFREEFSEPEPREQSSQLVHSREQGGHTTSLPPRPDPRYTRKCVERAAGRSSGARVGGSRVRGRAKFTPRMRAGSGPDPSGDRMVVKSRVHVCRNGKACAEESSAGSRRLPCCR